MTGAGEFRPYGKFVCAQIPLELMRLDTLSPGAKLVWARLCLYQGQDGEAFPSIDELAREVGTSARGVKRWLFELREAGFIRSIRRGPKRSNLYRFLKHPCFADLPYVVGQGSSDGPKVARQDGLDGPNLAHIKHQDNTSFACIDLDYLATNRKKRDSQPEHASRDNSGAGQWPELSKLAGELLGREPTRAALGRMISATPNKTEAEAMEAVAGAVRCGYGRDSKNGPRSWSWFVSVIRNYWSDRGNRALPPAAVNPSLDASEFERLCDVF